MSNALFLRSVCIFTARLECSQPYQYGQRQTGATQKIPSCQYIRGSARLSVARNVNVLLNFQRIKTVLDHCILSCQNHGCRFSCYGENIKAFYAHVNDCRFAHVPCPNRTCRQRILRARSVRHKVKCRYKLTKCLNDGCGREFTRREYKIHKRTCRYVHVRCPNYKYSCKHVFRLKDTKAHLKICKYQSVDCNFCGEKVFRVEMENHKIKSCPNGLVSCSGCSIMVKRMNLEKHQEVCLQYVHENHGSTKEFVKKPIQDLVPQDMPTTTESKHRSLGMDTMSASATNMRERYLQKCFYNSLPVTKADKQRHVGCQGQTRNDPGSSVLQ